MEDVEWSEVKQMFDARGNHWLVAKHATLGVVRGQPVSYEGIASLGPLRGIGQYWGNQERVYMELPVKSAAECVVTDYDDEQPDKDWSALWRAEREAALTSVPLHPDLIE